ncbi:hypothetical protein O1M63_36205 [Streptomyces mirabilis]|nr:hypothetical protein [Streptomyces mirabilis]
MRPFTSQAARAVPSARAGSAATAVASRVEQSVNTMVRARNWTDIRNPPSRSHHL